MDILQLFLLAAVGVLGGALSGLAGIGGGIVFVPGLVYIAGWDIRSAVAASLVIITFSALSGTLRNARSPDPPDWRLAGLLSLAVAPAALIGVFISRISAESLIQTAFALLLVALVYPISRGGIHPQQPTRRIPLPVVAVAGVGIGALSGLLGIGGGVMLVPLMVLAFGTKAKSAISNSLAIVLATSVVGAGGYIATGFDDFIGLPPLVLGAVAGAWAGVQLRDVLPERAVRQGFAALMVVVALRILAEAAGLF